MKWCDGIINCIDRTDESNCFETTSKPYKDVFEDCKVNKTNNYKNYAAVDVDGFRCGTYCLDTNIWCNPNGLLLNEDLEQLSVVCHDLVDQVGNPILCSNSTFWNGRRCYGKSLRHKDNTPGHCKNQWGVLSKILNLLNLYSLIST